MDINNIFVVLLTGLTSILLTSIITSISKRNSRKLKNAQITVDIYSPIVKFLTSLEFLETDVNSTTKFLEEKAYELEQDE